jgi:surface protein
LLASAFKVEKGKPLIGLLILLVAIALGLIALVNTPAKAANGSQANTSDFIVEYKGLTSTNSSLIAYFQSPVNVQAKWLKNGVQITPHSTNCPTAIPVGTTNVQVKCLIAAPVATDVIRLEVSAIPGQTGSIVGFGRTAGDITWGPYISDLVSFGNFGITSLKSAFFQSPATFQVTATLPNTVRDLTSAFQQSSANPDLSGWDTSAVTDMTRLFSQAANFNQNIGGWDTSSVTSMDSTFSSANAFNQNIGNWNTSSVTSMRAMFNAARAFNQNIGGWDTSAVTNMSMMFAGANVFNQELTSWNVSNVTNMSLMFSESYTFNNGDPAQWGTVSSVTAGTKPLSWTTSSLTNTAYMFRGAKAFNQNINSWNVSKVTDFNHMFAGLDSDVGLTNGVNRNSDVIFFNNGGVNDNGNGTPGSAPLWASNPPGTGTGTSPIDMSYMFSGAQFFNQDINSWDTSYVTTMLQMFESAQGFNNGDAKYSSNSSGSHNFTLSTGRVTTFLGMFYNTPAFNQNLNTWEVSQAVSFRSMFANPRANNTSMACNCTWFNNGNSNNAVTNNTMTWLASGSTAAAVDMSYMFDNNPYFNQDLTGWNVGKVTDFTNMFYGAIAFNNGEGLVAPGTKPLTWDTSSATSLSQMFFGAYKFNQNIDNWDTSKVSTFSGMFTSAGAFNNGLAAGTGGTMIWRTTPGVASTMSNMFNSAVGFNQNVSAWNTSAITNMTYMFSNAARFNNGQPAGTSGGADLTFSTANVTSFSNMFAYAAVFNQKVSSFDTSKVTAMDNMFNRANAFNNGQTPGGVGQNPITWNTSNVTTINSMFLTSGTYSFNQALPGWNLAKCTDYGSVFVAGATTPFNNGAAAGQSSVMNWTINTSQVASTITMYQMFQGAAAFNADISGWDVSGVTNMGSMFFSASSFNQNISGWNTQRVTNFSSTFRNTSAFNVDISSWNMTKATTLANMFDGAASFNQDLASFQLTSLTSSGLSGIFGSTASNGMSEANLEATTISWSHQTPRTGFPSTGTYDAFGKSRWLNCVGYYGYVRMNAKQAMTTWATLAAAPTGCSTATVSWYGASTGVATSQTISTSTINFTPATATSTTGSAPRFVVLERGATACRVNNVTGVITYTTAGSCTVRAYDTASLTNGDNTTYKDVIFSLPTPVVATAPTAPSITSVTGGLDRLTVAFTAPSSDGGLAVSGYKYRVAVDSTAITSAPWVDASVSSGSFVISSGLTRLQSYVVQLAAVNGAGQGTSSAVSTAATVLGTPSAPSITAVTAGGLRSLTITFTAPTSDGGSAITGYQYQLNGDGIWRSTGAGTGTTFTLSSLQTPVSYTAQIRAITGSVTQIYGDASTSSSAVTTYDVPGAPTINSVTAGPASSLEVAFSAPSNNGGLTVSGYKYRVAADTNALTSATWVSVSSTTSPIAIAGLNPGNTYVVELAAVNAGGDGSATAISSPVILPQVPGSVRMRAVIPAGSQAQVLFLPPLSDGGSAIQRYEYRYKYATSASPATLDNATASWSSINSAAWSAWATTPTLSETLSGSDIVKTFYITGLPVVQGGLWIIAEVRAVSSAGAGQPSVYRPGTTDVTFVEDGTQSGDGFIKFHYHLTYDGNSPILGYEYMLYTSSTGWTGWTDMGTTSDALPFTVTGLTNGQAYSVRVRARNVYGAIEGQPSFSTLSQAATPNKPMPTGTLTYANAVYAPNSTISPTTATRSGDGAITFRSQYTSICTVDNSGTISVLTAGSCLIYMDVAEGTTTRATSFSAWANISRAAQSPLSWNVSSTTGAYLTTITLALNGGSGDGAITYAKATGSTCSISGAVVTLGAVGTVCSVYATKAADTNYNTIMTSANLSLTSTQAAQTAVSFSNSSSMDAGQTLTLKANGGSGTGAYVFSVSSQGATGCSLNGAVLSAPSTGSCTVSVTRQSSTNYQASTAVTQVITVNPVVQTVRFTSVVPSQPIAGGTYSPSGTATSGLPVQISVLSGSCSITSGTVTFAAFGDCVLALDQSGDGTYSAATQVTQTIAVGLRNQALSFTAATNAILAKTYGDLAFLVEASSTEASAAITYSLSSTTTNGACSVTSGGLVTVLAVGLCAIDADSASTAAFAAASRITKSITVQSDFAGAPSLGSVSGGNLSATLGFYAPGYDGGTAITGYQVVAIDQTLGSSVQVTESACSTTSVNGLIICRVTGLENGTTYKLKVAPINEAGLGAYSGLSGAVTVATNPSAVQNLTVTEGNASLTISWSSPDSLGGGTFSAYRIFIKRSDALSYDQNHFYNVTNQATSSITVTRESPTDGFSFAGGPVFMNGVGYDVKVVTVTTANLLELETNTAVVNQIPHTVPDAPAVATAIVLGNQLVIAWTSPLSDGGKPVSAYTVSIGNTTCALAVATDLQCATALPTAPGDYRFEVRAVNAAGFSAPTSVLFHVAAIVVPPVQVPINSGGGSTPEAPKPEIAPEVYSVALSTDGKSATIIGKGLAKIKSLNFGSTQATVLASDNGRIVASSVGLKPGIYDLFITFNDGTTLRVEGALVIAGKPVVVAKPIKFTVAGFAKGSDKLTSSRRISIEKFLKANKTIKSIECIGSTEGPTVLKIDAKLAMKRGAAVCSVAKKLGIKVLPVSYVNRSQTGAKYRSVEIRINR